MESKVLENHKLYLERVNFYRSFGYDLELERDFIIDKSLPILGEILEIGTGKGHFALALAKRGYIFRSIDISKEGQEIALLNLKYFKLEKNVDLSIEDARFLSFRSKSFDTIFSINVFHHLEEPLKVLKEITRVLTPFGKVILSDFTDKGLGVINTCHTQENRRHDYFKHNLDEAKEYFFALGFEVKEFESQLQRVLVVKKEEKGK